MLLEDLSRFLHRTQRRLESHKELVEEFGARVMSFNGDGKVVRKFAAAARIKSEGNGIYRRRLR